ncbi:hypothetical protein [Dyadobacter sp. Leaf189]|uniref:hypothetical protein n=1 Tax=Dyadobacter sp. Leaf189 TaxID=1736295 RepID=UPI0006FFD072|nr:hypothetical protein [Dyadobacter sp. Leaf189]KQS24670.1 hypothetical protein ASG33_23185 [Dyadobacter sp. Leaf189]
MLQYSPDADEPLLNISKLNFTNLLKRFIENLNFENLVERANIIEPRDDLDFEVAEMQEMIFELANPEINGELTKERLQEIIAYLKE